MKSKYKSGVTKRSICAQSKCCANNFVTLDITLAGISNFTNIAALYRALALGHDVIKTTLITFLLQLDTRKI